MVTLHTKFMANSSNSGAKVAPFTQLKYPVNPGESTLADTAPKARPSSEAVCPVIPLRNPVAMDTKATIRTRAKYNRLSISYEWSGKNNENAINPQCNNKSLLSFQ